MTRRRNEGGSNAIKGFLFQFDKTISEIIANPRKTIRFEQEEDIERENYYIQVKNRESAKYYPSSIQKATKQLLDLFLRDVNRKFCLYCHFKDKKPFVWDPTFDEIKVILGKGASKYNRTDINKFSSNFIIEFCNDYEAEFENVIGDLKKSFGLRTKDIAIIYHSIIRSYILDLAVKKLKFRETSYNEIKSIVANVQTRVSMDGYQNLLGSDKYEKLMRKQYLIHTRANIDNFERLFIIEYNETFNPADVMRIVTLIGRNYFIKHKSPQPYILLRKIDCDVMRKIKQELINMNFFFNDGTWFDGDIIRADKLFSRSTEESYGKVKFLPVEGMLKDKTILDRFHEIYEFYISDSLFIKNFDNRYIQIPVSNCQQVWKILK